MRKRSITDLNQRILIGLSNQLPFLLRVEENQQTNSVYIIADYGCEGSTCLCAGTLDVCYFYAQGMDDTFDVLGSDISAIEGKNLRPLKQFLKSEATNISALRSKVTRLSKYLPFLLKLEKTEKCIQVVSEYSTVGRFILCSGNLEECAAYIKGIRDIVDVECRGVRYL